MSYQALYRRYRPRTFSELVGQEHITTILKNQIANAHASHAYLFAGARGTGKTSTAKIFARAINCLSPVDGDACGKCEACRSMEEETVDIIEIDAASNNGVDDVRALIEQARFTPLYLKYKVYIIDEVHMLSSAASNALLKTLEEPPAHVVFLLATTEPQKMLPTVISRCQRYDFKGLSVQDIVATVRAVVQQAGASIDEEGLLAIARTADGGMRDALSLADQCIAFCGGHVMAKDVYDVLGSMDTDFLFRMADALTASDAAGALRLLDEIVKSGRDFGVFLQDLTQHMRALLLTKACGECMDLLDCTPETMARYMEQAKAVSEERLLRAIELMTKAQNEMKWLGRPRVLLEMVLVRICRPEDETGLLALADRVAGVEAALRGNVPRPAAAGPAAAVPAAQEAPRAAADAPPWEEEAPPEKKRPAKKTAKEAEPKPTQAKAPQEEPAAEETVAAMTDADTLFEKLKAEMRTENLSLYSAARKATRAMLNSDTLTLLFPKEKRTYYDMLNMPRNLEQCNALLEKVAPGKRLSMQLHSPVATDDKTKELRDMFGDKLIIKD